MRLAAILTRLTFDHLQQHVVLCRVPDFIVGANHPQGPYLQRWFLTPWRTTQRQWRERAEAAPTRWNRVRAWAINLLPNLYLHQFIRDDDDRALHDHPSWAVSWILQGCYIEHTIAAGGIHQRVVHRAGSIRFLPTLHTHRIELPRSYGLPQYCWTLFLFGPGLREWGFHCPEQGWIPWQQFTADGKPGEIGPGCDA